MQIEETEKLKQNLINSRETSSTPKVAFSFDNSQRTNSVPSLYELKEASNNNFVSQINLKKYYFFYYKR